MNSHVVTEAVWFQRLAKNFLLLPVQAAGITSKEDKNNFHEGITRKDHSFNLTRHGETRWGRRLCVWRGGLRYMGGVGKEQREAACAHIVTMSTGSVTGTSSQKICLVEVMISPHI